MASPTDHPKIRRRKRRRRRRPARLKDVQRLAVVFHVAEGLPLADMMRQVRKLARARETTVLIAEGDYSTDLILHLNEILYKVPLRIRVIVTEDLSTVPHGADARLILGGLLSEESFRAVKDRLYRLKYRKTIGPNWALEGLRDDVPYDADVHFTE